METLSQLVDTLRRAKIALAHARLPAGRGGVLRAIWRISAASSTPQGAESPRRAAQHMFIGPPGSGKTMLARACGILRAVEEALESRYIPYAGFPQAAL